MMGARPVVEEQVIQYVIKIVPFHLATEPAIDSNTNCRVRHWVSEQNYSTNATFLAKNPSINIHLVQSGAGVWPSIKS